jgi:electron transport complex protein RnfC
MERYIAVGGSAVRSPGVVRARIGTRFSELFAICGGFLKPPAFVAAGTPFLGRRLESLDEPVTKITAGAFASLPDRMALKTSKLCLGCGVCRKVCPVGLDPEELYKRIMSFAERRSMGRRTDAEVLHEAGLAECHGCGCCEIVCPSKLPLSTVIMETQFQEAAADAIP